MNGFGDKLLIEERVQSIKDQLEMTTSEYDKEKM